MKQFTLLLATVLLFANCDKKDENVLFTVPYQVEFEIPAGLNTIETHVFEISNIPTRMDSLLSAFNIDKSTLKSIDPRDAKMRVTLGGLDYSFIREIEVYVFDQTFDKQIFFHNQVPLNAGGELPIIPTLVDAQDFLLQDKFNLRIELQLREFPSRFIPTRFNFSFKAK